LAKNENITAADWARSLGSGLLAGALFVAVAMLLENKIIKAGMGLPR